MQPKECYVTVPRGSGKRLLVLAMAIQHAKEGNRVLLTDIGGQNKILEPLGDGNVLIRPAKNYCEEETK